MSGQHPDHDSGAPATTAFPLPEPDFSPPPIPKGWPHWKHFAWAGWDIETPVDWDLKVMDLGPETGFIRLDDEFEPRLMLRWHPSKGSFEPRRSIELYFRHLKRKRIAEDRDLELNVALPGLAKAMSGMEHSTFSTRRGDARTVGLAACCTECGRAFVAELSLREEGGAGDRLISRVLGRLQEHCRDKLSRWEIFGLSTDLPAGYRATTHAFNQGFVCFTAAGPGETVTIARWTLANIHLDRVSLPEFAKRYLQKNMPSALAKGQDCVIQGHPAWISATRPRLLERVRSLKTRLIPSRLPPHAAVAAWHCATSNRIIILLVRTRRPGETGNLRTHAARVRCCKVFA